MVTAPEVKHGCMILAHDIQSLGDACVLFFLHSLAVSCWFAGWSTDLGCDEKQ